MMMNKLKTIILIVLLTVSTQITYTADDLIIDSDLSFEEAIKGTQAPKDIIKSLTIIEVDYFSFDGKLHRGQLVLRKDRVEEIQQAFKIMRDNKFPVAKCIPIVKYDWNDNKSMADNNTSMFNYRKIAGKNKLSNHSYGVAIDINPFQNPAVYKSGKVSPKGAKYDKTAKGTLLESSPVTQYFKSRGWRWGGDWNSLKDWQHFDKK
jgi:hypothetical protein